MLAPSDERDAETLQFRGRAHIIAWVSPKSVAGKFGGATELIEKRHEKLSHLSRIYIFA